MYEMYGYACMWDCLRWTPIYMITSRVSIHLVWYVTDFEEDITTVSKALIVIPQVKDPRAASLYCEGMKVSQKASCTCRSRYQQISKQERESAFRGQSLASVPAD